MGPAGGVGDIGAGRGCRGCWGNWGGRWTGSPTTLGPSPGSQHSHWQGYKGCWGIRGCGASGGVGGVSRVLGGGRWTGSLTTLGPSPGSQHCHWFSLGIDLPQQGQARAPVLGPITPTGFPWGVTYLTKTGQVTEMSSTACYIPLKLHLVTICSFVSILPNHIFLHAM